MKKVIYLLIFILFLASGALAQDPVPQKILFQAKLYGTDGRPYTGYIRLGFLIYDVASGGTYLWRSYSFIEPEEVMIRDGLFEKILEVPFSIFNRTRTYLEIEYWTSRGRAAILTPRLQFFSAPYALNTYYLTGLQPKVSGADAHIVKTDRAGRAAFGNVGTREGYALSAEGSYAGAQANSTVDSAIVGETTSTPDTLGRYGIYAASVSLTSPAIKAENTADGAALEIFGGALFIDNWVSQGEYGPFYSRLELEEFWMTIYYAHVGPIGIVPFNHGVTTFKVYNNLLTSNSIILLTPYGSASDQEPYIESTGEDVFPGGEIRRYFVVNRGGSNAYYLLVQFMIIN